VVNCGTATTIDTLSGQGEFLGGLIVPGVELMQHSLSAATDQLKSRLVKQERGEYVPLPRNTDDALFSGAVQATCGAIERQYALLDDAAAPVVFSGGAARVLQKHLNLPVNVADNLVLQGLLLIAREAGA
jgi:type III pantothenate kinase